MNGCIYRTKDGECDLWSEDGKYKAWCEMADCPSRKPSYADRIRAMADEELASVIMKYIDCNLCRVERGHCDKDYAECKGAWLDWLRQEATT